MAVKSIIVCDLHGEECSHGDASTTSFSWEGRAYTVDLCEEGKQVVHETLAPLMQVARVGWERPPKTSRRGGSGLSRQELQEVRQWAGAHGIKVSEKGRVAEKVIIQWRETKDAPAEGATEQPVGEAATETPEVKKEPRKTATKKE